ncbi:MAG: Crp/Fnr family transcriptional regulator [Carnobacterium sp.]|uniref:Crp/Fnr family transcriptional regulator n=1 Tax=Carnobacterium sp. TaxID=48221 RepID=UPI002FC9985B
MDKRKSISHHTCECACKAKKQDCIQTVPIFQSLTAEQMGKVHSLIHRKQFFHGEMIYRPGKRADSFYVLKSGKLRVYRLLESGKEQLVRMVNQNEFTGELALFKKGVYEAFAQPQSDCSICAIKHEDFRELLLERPSISIEMLGAITNRLSTSEQQAAWATTETVRNRLLHFLISLIDSTEKKPLLN